MRKLFLFASIIISLSVFHNCSGGSDEEIQIKNDFTNAEYIKSQMIGKWNYWGHNSPGYGWVYSGDIYKWYFEFKSDNTYTDKSSTIQTGTYTITPATNDYNPVLHLTYSEGNKTYIRNIVLKSLEGKTAIIYESAFDERYDKQ